MNILIVDDEVIVVNLLKKHIDWQGLGIHEVFTAYTAMDARRLVSGNQIDIIICDIEMPQENGLMLLAWIRENFPDIVKIILTGYPDFKYAQDAINIGVVKYLLKPVSFEELSETIRLAAEEINKKRNESLQGNAGQNVYDPKREEKIFYTNLITGDILPFTEFINKAAEVGGLARESLEPKGLVYIRLTGTQVQVKNNSILLFALSNIAEELFAESRRYIFGTISSGLLKLIMTGSKSMICVSCLYPSSKEGSRGRYLPILSGASAWKPYPNAPWI